MLQENVMPLPKFSSSASNDANASSLPLQEKILEIFVANKASNDEIVRITSENLEAIQSISKISFTSQEIQNLTLDKMDEVASLLEETLEYQRRRDEQLAREKEEASLESRVAREPRSTNDQIKEEPPKSGFLDALKNLGLGLLFGKSGAGIAGNILNKIPMRGPSASPTGPSATPTSKPGASKIGRGGKILGALATGGALVAASNDKIADTIKDSYSKVRNIFGADKSIIQPRPEAVNAGLKEKTTIVEKPGFLKTAEDKIRERSERIERNRVITAEKPLESISKPSAAADTIKDVPNAPGKANKVLSAGKGLLKAVPVIGQVAAAGMAGFDAYSGYQEAASNLDIKDREATTGEKLSSAAGSVVSGLTFGLLDTKKASKGIASFFGAGPDKPITAATTTPSVPSTSPAASNVPSAATTMPSASSSATGGGMDNSPKLGNITVPSSTTPLAAPSAVPGGSSKSLDQVAKIGSNVDISGLNPALKERLAGFASEFQQQFGRKIQINSAYRDPKKQAELYAKDPSRAAPPGKSRHEHGLAFDMNSAEANQAESSGLFAKYGLMRPIRSEPWHIEPIESRGKPFGGDNPINPGAPVMVASKSSSGVVPASGTKVDAPKAATAAAAPSAAGGGGKLPKPSTPAATQVAAAAPTAAAVTPAASATPASAAAAQPVPQEAQKTDTASISVPATMMASAPTSPDLNRMSTQVASAATAPAPQVTNIVAGGGGGGGGGSRGGAPQKQEIPSPLGNRGSLDLTTTFIAAA
jgi:hypothetical protein